MNKSPLWIFITLGIFLGVSQSFFFLTPIVILSYFIFIKKILLKDNLKDSFFGRLVFWDWVLYWFNALDNLPFFNL